MDQLMPRLFPRTLTRSELDISLLLSFVRTRRLECCKQVPVDRISTSSRFMERATAQISSARLYLITSAMLGIQYAWAVQVGVTTAVLLEFGMSVRWVSLAWLAGPVSGLVVQPVVGLVSDRCSSRYGRRRPFVAGGAILTAASMLAFAYAEAIASFYGFLTPLTVAIIAFWCLDFSINAMQGPLRALVYDHVEASEQERGNAALAANIAAGNLLGSMLASSALTRDTLLRHWFSTDTEALYVVGAVLVVGTALMCWIASAPLAQSVPPSRIAREPALARIALIDSDSRSMQPVLAMSSPTSPKRSFLSLSELVYRWRRVLLSAPATFWKVFLIQMGSWYGWFCLFVFGSSWFGVNVLGGDPYAPVSSPQRKRYDEGVHRANRALAIQSVVAFLYAAALPRLQCRLGRYTPMQLKYGIAQLVQVFAMLLMVTIGARSVGFAMSLQALLGIPWASSVAIPWAIVGTCVATGDAPDMAGTFATLFNASQCLPEIVVALLSPVLEGHGSRASQHDRVLASGAFVVALSTFLVPFIHAA
jgi:solute carrier family 45 protein 1/2/4